MIHILHGYNVKVSVCFLNQMVFEREEDARGIHRQFPYRSSAVTSLATVSPSFSAVCDKPDFT